jgi:putative ABC transport system permease protein
MAALFKEAHMEIRPIFASLRKHRIPAILIVLEIALACAVLCNAVFMIGKRVGDIRVPDAIDERALSVIVLNGADPKLASSDIPRNLAALRSIAGVQSVGVTSTLPLTRNNWGWSFGLKPESLISDKGNLNVSLYFLGAGADQALGLQLLQGRFFNADEYADSSLGGSALPSTHVVIVTDSLAAQLWPGKPPLGQVLYSKPNYYTVVGVVANVLRPQASIHSTQRSFAATFYPLQADSVLGYYVLRSAPQDRARIVREAEQKLGDINPAAVAKGQTFIDIRDTYFADMSSMAWMLVLVCVVMLAVTAFGIVGLTSFWVAQRRRQIGIRRAVGATRGDILSYFRTENFLLTSMGVVLGMALAFGINIYLMHHYEMDRMPWYYLPASAVALWLLGQLAVLGPALRAAAVPPVVATRSV